MSSLWKSSAVVLAVTAYKLLSHASRPSWLPEEELVLQAFRRSTNALQNATPNEIGAYLSNFDSTQREGMLNNVKGIFHELLYEKLENNDGDEIFARVIEKTNHPGADVELLIDGNVIKSVQLKAVASPEYILKHFAEYPEYEVLATSEMASRMDGVESSGFSLEADVTRPVQDIADRVEGSSIGEEIPETMLIGAGIKAASAIRRRDFSNEELRSVLEGAALGGATSLLLDLMLGPSV